MKPMLWLFSLRASPGLTLQMEFNIIEKTGPDFPPFMFLNWYVCLSDDDKQRLQIKGNAHPRWSFFVLILKHQIIKSWTSSAVTIACFCGLFEAKKYFRSRPLPPKTQEMWPNEHLPLCSLGLVQGEFCHRWLLLLKMSKVTDEFWHKLTRIMNKVNTKRNIFMPLFNLSGTFCVASRAEWDATVWNVGNGHIFSRYRKASGSVMTNGTSVSRAAYWLGVLWLRFMPAIPLPFEGGGVRKWQSYV